MHEYPGHALLNGSTGPDVAAVQRRLNERGCGPVAVTGTFDVATARAVKTFQARFPDAMGQPLVVDGKVGPITWEVLFGVTPAAAPATPSLATAALVVAATEVDTMEAPAGSNRGPKVDQYVSSVGLDPAGRNPWCAAFVYWCFSRAAADNGVGNPVIKTGSVLTHWRRAGEAGVHRIAAADAMGTPALVQPGFVFIMDYGGGVGHTGFVEQVTGGRLITIEGNTNNDGSREGVGVFRREGRKIASINKGFLDYSR
jgi:hypothetical protein